ncbi:hypothetical protein Vau01_121750 [Virgisporangium aurantiacum]|uniref:Uncharacterized protein n=1 Tax=Virgisporangium aurantiacum TaxID=175570 RepID=A0A8J4E7T7_9ACTN|nr:hypothetical protein Vau01_121750 [Virgisporangium aurantiacum]
MADQFRRREIADDAEKLASPRPVPIRVLDDADPGTRRQGHRRPLIGQRSSHNVLDRRAVASALTLIPRSPDRHVIIVVNGRAPRQAEPRTTGAGATIRSCREEGGRADLSRPKGRRS